MEPYRFHIMWRRINEEEFRDFFQTNDIYEAKISPCAWPLTRPTWSTCRT